MKILDNTKIIKKMGDKMKKWITLILVNFIQTLAYAEQGGEMVKGSSEGGLYAIAAAIAIGVAVIGGALGQGKIGSSAMEGLARNPQAQKNMFVSMVLGFAFIESIVIFSLVIAFLILNKL